MINFAELKVFNELWYILLYVKMKIDVIKLLAINSIQFFAGSDGTIQDPSRLVLHHSCCPLRLASLRSSRKF